MKTFVNFFLILIGIVFSSKAQEIQHVFKWEASTISGGVFIGITNKRMEALLIIEHLMSEKNGDQDILDFDIRFSPVKTSNNNDVFDEFLTLTPENNNYAYLTREDFEAIRVNKQWGKANCISYYENNNTFKNKKSMLQHLNNQVLTYEKFLFLSKNDRSREIYTLTTNQKARE